MYFLLNYYEKIIKGFFCRLYRIMGLDPMHGTSTVHKNKSVCDSTLLCKRTLNKIPNFSSSPFRVKNISTKVQTKGCQQLSILLSRLTGKTTKKHHGFSWKNSKKLDSLLEGFAASNRELEESAEIDLNQHAYLT